MSESFNEEVEAFLKACDYVRLKPPGPDKLQALRELTEKQGKKQLGETRVLQNVLLEYVGVEIDEDDWVAIEEKLEKKGNRPMDEELFQRVEVDIEKFTRAAMELQVAVINAEAQLKDAKQQWTDVEKTLRDAKQQWNDAEKRVEEARGQLRHHLDSVRGKKVTMPAPPDWGQNVYKVGERDA